MRTNEVPEKIYIDDPTGEFDDHWYTSQNNVSVEYTHTDVFIGKAWNWIEDNILSSSQQDKSRLYYKQFENYIKEN